jgi:ribulose-5-phosphate 4-epimerase/fuculose-1-phosphate aldolase
MSAAEIQEAKELIAELCANLYTQGHVSGTGGGISIKVNDTIVMAPSGVQKERMRAEDMFVLNSNGDVVHTPEARPPPYKAPKLSECAPLFMSVRTDLHLNVAQPLIFSSICTISHDHLRRRGSSPSPR